MGVGMNTAITHLQLFILGLSLGFAGPCLLSCGPIMATYIAGRRVSFLASIRDIIIFLSGRLLAYVALGYAAGFFANYIRMVADKVFLPWLRLSAGIIIILMGIYVAIGEKFLQKICPARLRKAAGISSLFILGVIIGLSPCPPLMAVLIEIAYISKNGMDAVFYALSFGLGTLISGLLTLGVLCGLFSWLPAKIFHSRRVNLVFRIVCAMLLILLGLNIIFGILRVTF